MSEAGKLYQQWADSFASVGLSHLSRDTAARILAVVGVYGGSSEAFKYNEKLRIDMFTAQRMFNINGGEIPDPEGVMMIKEYTEWLEDDLRNTKIGDDPNAFAYYLCKTEWANKLFKDRYGIKKLLL